MSKGSWGIFLRGDFAAPAASDFLSDEKVTKESPGDAAEANFVRQ